jgi:thiopeptide-type bacteriocin biosynthesis protein
VAITTAFTGSTEAGMKWLITYAKTETPRALDRPLLAEAVRLPIPQAIGRRCGQRPAARRSPKHVEPRHRALSDYRARLQQAEGIDPDAVLDSLLHAHHIRSVGIDRDHERTCIRLARAAALTWTARNANRQGR